MRGALAAIAAALAGGPEEAAAAELVLEEPTACVTRDELSFRVERLLGRPLADVEEMVLSVGVEAAPGGFVARLEVSRPGAAGRGERILRAPSCDELSEALAVAISVAIGELDEPAPARITASEAPPVVDAAPPAPVPPPASGVGLTLGGSAWMIADTGTLPSLGLGAGIGIELSWPSIELRALGTLLPAREATLDAAGSPGVSIGLMAGGAMACVPLRDAASLPAIAACAGWELGLLSGNGTHVSSPYQRRALWSAARFDVAARWVVPDTASRSSCSSRPRRPSREMSSS